MVYSSVNESSLQTWVVAVAAVLPCWEWRAAASGGEGGRRRSRNVRVRIWGPLYPNYKKAPPKQYR